MILPFRFFFMMMTPKSSFTARRLGWAIYFNGYHKKETKRERKAQRNILMKTLGTSKNHAGCIGPIHSSNAWQRTGKKKIVFNGTKNTGFKTCHDELTYIKARNCHEGRAMSKAVLSKHKHIVWGFTEGIQEDLLL